MQYVFENVAEAYRVLEERKEKSIDYIATAEKLRMVVYNDNEVRLHIYDNIGRIINRLPLNDWAHSQLAQKLGIPAKYYDKMRFSKKLGLLAMNVNTWLDELQSKKIMVRAFENEHIRAILSDSYMIIPDLGVYITALQELQNIENSYGVKITIQQSALTDTHLYLKAYSEDMKYIIDEESDDFVYPGIIVRNSEVGASKFSVQPLLFRPICKNGLIGAHGFSRIHLGNRKGEGVIRWSEKTKMLENATIKSKIRDAIRQSFDPQIFTKWGEALKQGHEFKIEDRVETVEALKLKFNYSENDIKNILSHFGAEKNTMWGLANGITRYAQDVGEKDYDRQIKLEEHGAIVATMTKEEIAELIRHLREKQKEVTR